MLDLDKIEKKVDDALAQETPMSLLGWLRKYRVKNKISKRKQMKTLLTTVLLMFVSSLTFGQIELTNNSDIPWSHSNNVYAWVKVYDSNNDLIEYSPMYWVENTLYRTYVCLDTGVYTIQYVMFEGLNARIDSTLGTPSINHNIIETLWVTSPEKCDLSHSSDLYYYNGKFEYILGMDSPENFLAYPGIAEDDGGKSSAIQNGGTYTVGGTVYSHPGDGLHRYANHLQDYVPTKFCWAGAEPLFGSIFYLYSLGANSISFLSYNLNGDGDEVYPWIDPDTLILDTAKLNRWNKILGYTDSLGVWVWLKLFETENDNSLFQGDSLNSVGRKYISEMLARFGHYQKVVWIIGEENTLSDEQNEWLIKYLKRRKVLVTIHTYPNQQANKFLPLISFLDGLEIQSGPGSLPSSVDPWLNQGKTITWSEPGGATNGVSSNWSLLLHQLIRYSVKGMAGCLYYTGYSVPFAGDLDLESFRKYELQLKQGVVLKNIIESLPWDLMTYNNGLSDPITDDQWTRSMDTVLFIYVDGKDATIQWNWTLYNEAQISWINMNGDTLGEYSILPGQINPQSQFTSSNAYKNQPMYAIVRYVKPVAFDITHLYQWKETTCVELSNEDSIKWEGLINGQWTTILDTFGVSSCVTWAVCDGPEIYARVTVRDQIQYFETDTKVDILKFENRTLELPCGAQEYELYNSIGQLIEVGRGNPTFNSNLSGLYYLRAYFIYPFRYQTFSISL